MADGVRRQLNMHLNEVELARLEAVAEHYGLTPPALFRMLVKREYDSIEGKKKT